MSSKEGYHLIDASNGDNELVLSLPESDSTAPRQRPVSWSPDGRTLLMTYSARDKWERGLVRYDLESRRTHDLIKDSGLYGNWRFSETGERVFYAFSNGDMPNDLFVADSNFDDTERLTN